MRPSFIASSLFFIFFIQGIYLIQATSPTTDEVPFHMVNGYAYLKTHDYRMSPANPPLLREWMALPWLLINPKLDLEKASWKEADSMPFGVEFFYRDNRRIANRLLYTARFMILMLGMGLGTVIFLWSQELYGIWGGILSLSLYVFCPGFAAHSSIAHTDVGVTFFCALAAYFLWKFLEKETTRTLLWTAAAFSLACAAKFNALYLGPLFLMILLVKRGPKVSLKASAIFLIFGFIIIWSTYFFETKPLLAGGVPRIDEKLGYITTISNVLFHGNPKMAEFLKEAALKTPIPLPSYILGLAGILRSHESPYLHYAFGEWTTKPHWFFYIFSFLVKMTIPFLCFLLLRALFFRKCSSVKGNERFVILLPTVALFFITAKDSTGVGIRYLFPIIPLLMVWVGGLVKLRDSKIRMAIALLITFNIVSVARIFPNYLSYFNEFVGGVKGGCRYVRGSDADWGQGLKDLKRYQDKNRIQNVALDYFGSADPSFYGISFERITDEERKIPRAKVYAVSIFNLEHTQWSHEADPTAVVGGSIFIYDFRKAIKG